MLLKKTGNKNMNSSAFIKPTSAAAIIFSLVMLFNPYVSVVDILPDFIGYFVLARVFEKAADCAPYFEEARTDFLKLGFLSLMKIPAMFVIVFAHSKNTFDNDTVVLATLIFSVAEIILTIMAIEHIFAALTYLGNRTKAESLIKTDTPSSTDRVKSLSHIFFISKSVFAFIPESLKLTRSIQSENNVILVTGSNYYAPVLLLSIAAVLILGIAWLLKTSKYVKRISAEGNFDAALISIASASAENEFLKRRKKRNRFRALNLLFISSLFTFRAIIGNYYGINVIPPFVFGAMFLLAVISVSAYVEGEKRLKKLSYALCGAYIPISSVSYVLSFNFLKNYGYSLLYDSASYGAVKLYRFVIIFSLLELCFFIASMAAFALIMKKYITCNLGLMPYDENYSRQDMDYHKSLFLKTLIFVCLASLTALTKFIDVCLHFNMQLIYTDPHHLTTSTMLVPSLPWFNTVVFASCAVFAIYAFYYVNLLKQEHNPL